MEGGGLGEGAAVHPCSPFALLRPPDSPGTRVHPIDSGSGRCYRDNPVPHLLAPRHWHEQPLTSAGPRKALRTIREGSTELDIASIVPETVKIVEVGPRDGFQNLKDLIPTEVKQRAIELLIEAGVNEIEVTSFVHPKAIPQMADAMTLGKYIVDKYGTTIRAIALVPNERGAENAMKCGFRDVRYVISVSESHNMENVKRTKQQSLEELGRLIQNYPDLRVGLDVSTAFGCPFEGKVPESAVVAMVDAALSSGVSEIILCDTIGVANPLQTQRLATKVMNAFPDVPIGLHMHDTRGMGLANALAGLAAGITRHEASVGGLGGCPFAPGAAGNTATEDLLNMFLSMGIETGIDFEKYMQAAEYVRKNIHSALTGHMINARSCSV